MFSKSNIVLLSSFVLLIILPSILMPPFQNQGKNFCWLFKFNCVYYLNKGLQEERIGKIVQLTRGKTHYHLDGNCSGDFKLFFFIHGLLTPASIAWEDLSSEIRKEGYCTLYYDLYGRGWSDAPDDEYNLGFLVTQAVELLFKLDLRPSELNVVGLSMGGSIAADFANVYSEKVSNLILIAPAGLSVPSLQIRFLSTILRIPALGEVLTKILSRTLITNLVTSGFYNVTKHPEFVAKGQVMLGRYFNEHQSIERVLLSTMRYNNAITGDNIESFRELGKKNINTLLIWGKHDIVTPFQNYKVALNLMPHTQFVAVEDAGHNALVENPDVIKGSIVKFLKK